MGFIIERLLMMMMMMMMISATRIPGHVQPVGRPCGTWMHYAMRDGSANGLPQPRMELAERSHEYTYWGWYCSWSQTVLTF